MIIHLASMGTNERRSRSSVVVRSSDAVGSLLCCFLLRLFMKTDYEIDYRGWLFFQYMDWVSLYSVCVWGGGGYAGVCVSGEMGLVAFCFSALSV